MNKKDKLTISEFKSQGDDAKDAAEMLLFTKNLSNLYSFQRSKQTKDKFLNQIDNPLKTSSLYSRVLYALPILFLFFVVFSHVASATQQGQALYPLKVLSQKVYERVSHNLGQSPQNNETETQDLETAKENEASIDSNGAATATPIEEKQAENEIELPKNTGLINASEKIKDSLIQVKEIIEKNASKVEDKKEEVEEMLQTLPSQNLQTNPGL
ncbi:MAG: hypothetical protein A2798_03205 [Candidatus Levybacteria bacterium RIFCSPHIGHO2_01_FULL_37_17]|nr:MAG: hypothetical protein A2798_03205 [Candidatus Levybacteria bacterium RIFCSPHIGHO2_01_FULL_37_17]OGH36862.1 MAG: hypothetical protein A2959_01195 [Candidatus Levybacteria bacterium RIFCSPLOWO2_01_FULL_38_23]